MSKLPPITGRLNLKLDLKTLLNPLKQNFNTNLVPMDFILDWTDGKLPCAEIFDANGKEWFNVHWINTQTGLFCYDKGEVTDQGTLKTYTDTMLFPIQIKWVTFPEKNTVKYLNPSDGKDSKEKS